MADDGESTLQDIGEALASALMMTSAGDDDIDYNDDDSLVMDGERLASALLGAADEETVVEEEETVPLAAAAAGDIGDDGLLSMPAPLRAYAAEADPPSTVIERMHHTLDAAIDQAGGDDAAEEARLQARLDKALDRAKSLRAAPAPPPSEAHVERTRQLLDDAIEHTQATYLTDDDDDDDDAEEARLQARLDKALDRAKSLRAAPPPPPSEADVERMRQLLDDAIEHTQATYPTDDAEEVRLVPILGQTKSLQAAATTQPLPPPPPPSDADVERMRRLLDNAIEHTQKKAVVTKAGAEETHLRMRSHGAPRTTSRTLSSRSRSRSREERDALRAELLASYNSLIEEMDKLHIALLSNCARKHSSSSSSSKRKRQQETKMQAALSNNINSSSHSDSRRQQETKMQAVLSNNINNSRSSSSSSSSSHTASLYDVNFWDSLVKSTTASMAAPTTAAADPDDLDDLMTTTTTLDGPLSWMKKKIRKHRDRDHQAEVAERKLKKKEEKIIKAEADKRIQESRVERKRMKAEAAAKRKAPLAAAEPESETLPKETASLARAILANASAASSTLSAADDDAARTQLNMARDEEWFHTTTALASALATVRADAERVLGRQLGSAAPLRAMPAGPKLLAALNAYAATFEVPPAEPVHRLGHTLGQALLAQASTTEYARVTHTLSGLLALAHTHATHNAVPDDASLRLRQFWNTPVSMGHAALSQLFE